MQYVLNIRVIISHINKCPTRCNTNSPFIILQVYSTRFWCQPHPSSGVHKTVITVSGSGFFFVCATTSLQRSQAWPVGGR